MTPASCRLRYPGRPRFDNEILSFKSVLQAIARGNSLQALEITEKSMTAALAGGSLAILSASLKNILVAGTCRYA